MEGWLGHLTSGVPPRSITEVGFIQYHKNSSEQFCRENWEVGFLQWRLQTRILHACKHEYSDWRWMFNPVQAGADWNHPFQYLLQTFKLFIKLFQNRVKGKGGKWKKFYNKKWELCAGKKYPFPKSEILSFRRRMKKNSQYEKEKKEAKVRTL